MSVIVQLRLVANTEAAAAAAVAAMRRHFGDQVEIDPIGPGRKGQFLVYGTLVLARPAARCQYPGNALEAPHGRDQADH